MLWTIRLSALLYAGALFAYWRRAPGARALSVAAYALYLAHVYLAFDQRYAWSHAAAYAETARQTCREAASEEAAAETPLIKRRAARASP